MFQFAWFTPSEVPMKADDAFQNALGMEPATVQRLRPPQTPFPMSVATGSSRGGDYRVQIQPNRIDLAVVPDETMAVPIGLPYLESDEFHFETLLKAARTISYTIGSVNRQALVVQRAHQCKSEEQMGEKFLALTGLSSALSEAKEMLFQANLRKPLSWADQTLNRLIKLGTESATVQVVTMTPHGPVQQNVNKSRIGHYISYMVDINNLPTAKQFDQGERLKLLDEMIQEYEKMKKFKTVGELI